jgi:hypothetical protein
LRPAQLVQFSKLSMITLARRIIRIEDMTNAHRILVGKPERKLMFRKTLHTWKDNIKLNIEGIVSEGWI